MKSLLNVKNLVKGALGVLVLACFAGAPAAAQNKPNQLPPQGSAPKGTVATPKIGVPAPVAGCVGHGCNNYGGCNNCGGGIWNGNGCCGNGCCQQSTGFYAAIGFYYVQPYWESNPAYTISTTNAAGTVTSAIVDDFDYDYEFVPRIWVGFESEDGLGGRIGWYKYDHSASDGLVNSNPLVTVIDATGNIFSAPGAGQTDTYSFTSDLVLDVWDFDVTQRFIDNSCWDLVGGVGIRYAHLSQDYNAWHMQSNGAVNGTAVAYSNTFNGAGPNVFLEGRRFVSGSGLAIYGNARAGVLYGTGRQTNFVATTFGGGFAQSTIGSRDDLLPFLNVELGVEMEGQDSGNGVVPFVRAGIVGQTWFGAGNGAASPTFNFENLGFFGLSVMAGGRF